MGIRGRLAGLPETGSQPRVAVVGPHTPLLAATIRAVGASSSTAVAIPVDSSARLRDDMLERIAEVQAHLVVVAGACTSVESMVKDVSQRLGASWVTAAMLSNEGRGLSVMEVASATASSESVDKSEAHKDTNLRSYPPLLLFSSRSGETAVRAAYVSHEAMMARISHAVNMWHLCKDDNVLSLALHADSPAAVVDALEAPLSIGAAISLPEASSAPLEVWDLWAAIRDEPSATVIFISSEWCEKLLDAYAELAPALRADLIQRWATRPLRFTVAVSPAEMSPSSEISDRWFEVFQCKLLWQYTCAEAGSLYVTQSAAGESEVGATGLELDLNGNDLWVRGAGVFECYHDRPKSTTEAFNQAGFCQTGHRVESLSGTLWPAPEDISADEKFEVYKHLERGPKREKLGMQYSWTVKKVKMRKYWYWMTRKRYKIVTKKDRQNALHLRYTPRYKRLASKTSRKRKKTKDLKWLTRYR